MKKTQMVSLKEFEAALTHYINDTTLKGLDHSESKKESIMNSPEQKANGKSRQSPLQSDQKPVAESLKQELQESGQKPIQQRSTTELVVKETAQQPSAANPDPTKKSKEETQL